MANVLSRGKSATSWFGVRLTWCDSQHMQLWMKLLNVLLVCRVAFSRSSHVGEDAAAATLNQR